jgi:hypothetical protein
MFAVALAAIVVVACSAIVGQGLAAIGGYREWKWWAPGVGFAALLTIAGVGIRVPGHSKGVVLAIAAATIASLAVRSVRRALWEAVPDGIFVTAAALLASLIPFVVWSRAGLLGEGMNNDSGAHLGTAWWLQHKVGPAPVGALGGPLAQVGYPVGPHGLLDALAVGHISLEHAFTGVIIAVAPLTALVALGGLRRRHRVWRIVAALLVGLSYLALSFQVQASFKETMEALLVLTVVLCARDLVREGEGWRWRAGIPLGVAIGGSVYVYSYGGLVWTVAAAAVVGLTSGRLRAAVMAVPGVLLGMALVIEPSIDQFVRFQASPFNHEVGDGNLKHVLSGFEVLGVWFGYDFRWTPNPLWPTVIGVAITVALAGIALVRLFRAHEIALPAAAFMMLAIYAYANDEKSIYLSAKTLTIAGPLVTLTIASGLLLPFGQGTPRGRRIGLGVLAGVVAVAAAFSSFLVLRDARVGPLVHRSELARLKAHIHGPVVFFPKNDQVQWELIGDRVTTLRHFYSPLTVDSGPYKGVTTIGFYDFDNLPPETLDSFDYAITTNTPYQSMPPRNWHRVAHTRSYILWHRDGRTPLEIATDFGSAPGRVLQCSTAYGQHRLALAGHGYALVLPRPVTGLPNRWHGETGDVGRSATMTLDVPRGHWDLSLAYAANTGLRVDAGGLHADMPATIDRVGPYYLVGTLDQRHSGPMTIRVKAKELPALGRLLGGHGHTRGLDTPANVPLGGVALTRHDQKPSRVQPRQACGRYVDHMVPGRS